MNSEDYLTTFRFLTNETTPSKKDLDEMSCSELEERLADEGYDLPAFKARISAKKKMFDGKFAFAEARRKLAKRQFTNSIKINLSDDRISLLEFIQDNYPEEQMAARNLKSLSVEDLKSLISDLDRANKQSNDK